MIEKLTHLKRITLTFIKYGLVGCTGAIIDFSITYVLVEFTDINIFVANALGFAFAATSNYYLNSIWTFSDRQATNVTGFIKFCTFSGIGLVLNYFFLTFIMECVGLEFYTSKFFATGLVLIWNFSINYIVTFRQKKNLNSRNREMSIDKSMTKINTSS